MATAEVRQDISLGQSGQNCYGSGWLQHGLVPWPLSRVTSFDCLESDSHVCLILERRILKHAISCPLRSIQTLRT